MKKVYLNELTKGKTDTEPLDINANKLQTEEQKIHWLENEIKNIEYILSSDCVNRNNMLCHLQMYRELLAIKRELKNEMHWHKYTNCGDAPNVKELPTTIGEHFYFCT